jgi:hypothetical protein
MNGATIVADGSRGGPDEPLGSPVSVPVLPREPDPLTDGEGLRGTQPSERRSAGIDPFGGGR